MHSSARLANAARSIAALPKRELFFLQKQQAVRASFQNYACFFKNVPDAWLWLLCEAATVSGYAAICNNDEDLPSMLSPDDFPFELSLCSSFR
jgi:hypothetical protein